MLDLLEILLLDRQGVAQQGRRIGNRIALGKGGSGVGNGQQQDQQPGQAGCAQMAPGLGQGPDDLSCAQSCNRCCPDERWPSAHGSTVIERTLAQAPVRNGGALR